MSRRFRRDPVKARIEAYGPLVLKLYKHLDREIRFPLDIIEWWTHVALRSAAAGAAVMLGGYRAEVAASARRADQPPPSDPVGRFALAIDEPKAMRAAYRVGVWAYMAEFTAELWSRVYEGELRDAARVLTVANPEEEQVCQLGGELLASGSARPADPELLRFRYGVFAALLSAATRTAVSAGDPSLEPDVPAWLTRYGEGKASAAERLKELSIENLPVPAW
jgi:hypothetical protein